MNKNRFEALDRAPGKVNKDIADYKKEMNKYASQKSKSRRK